MCRRLASGLGRVLGTVWMLPFSLQCTVAVLATTTVVALRERAVGTSWSAAPGREWRWRWVMAGTSTALLGWGLRKWAKQTLAGAFTYIISTPKELVTTGPYQWWVHPGYAGVIAHVTGLVMLAAVSCSHPFAITVCSVAFAVALVLLRIQDEETMLAATHHAQWAAHIETRWRLMPFVW